MCSPREKFFLGDVVGRVQAGSAFQELADVVFDFRIPGWVDGGVFGTHFREGLVGGYQML
jgi:hypothetical protein